MQTPLIDNNSIISPLEGYFNQVSDSYLLMIYIGGKLLPFDLGNDSYRWILFPILLNPGIYRLGLHLPSAKFYKPISAYGMMFPPGEKEPQHPIRNSLGYGFQITPAIATLNKFLPYQNTTEFKTNFNGIHQIGITTTYWTEEVFSTIFELMLLKKKKTSEISSYQP